MNTLIYILALALLPGLLPLQELQPSDEGWTIEATDYCSEDYSGVAVERTVLSQTRDSQRCI